MSDLILPSNIELIAPSDLVAFSRNSRTHSDEQVLQIVASIQEFGFTNPILISGEGEIIAGHGRVLAAERLGMAEVPCLRLSHLSDEQRRAYVIADNKLAENAGWDKELLALELGELRDLGFGIDVIGFSKDELELLFLDGDDIDGEGNTDDDAVPDAGDGYVSSEGDVWVLGDHLVMCGDSTVESDFSELMGSELADLCWTDPPYNVNYEGSAGKIKMTTWKAGRFVSSYSTALGWSRPTFMPARAVMWRMPIPRAGRFVGRSRTAGLKPPAAWSGSSLRLSWAGPIISGSTSRSSTDGRRARRTAGLAAGSRPPF
jgi:hypothetical protein